VEPAIRERIVSHLMNVDEALAQNAADRLGIATMPEPAPAARPTRMDLKPSPALSIQSRAPDSFKGRVMGVLISDGFDGALLSALEHAVAEAGGLVRIVAPKIGGAKCSNDNLHAVTDQLGGAPSVLFDAIAVLPGVDSLAKTPAAIDFLQDAHVHCKYIGLSKSAAELVAACGLSGAEDDGIHALTDTGTTQEFVTACRGLRFWEREAMIAD
jgi:catalase